MRKESSVIVLGVNQIGHAIAKSLAPEGIKLIGLDFEKTQQFYSSYIDARKCPHPLKNSQDFICYLLELSSEDGNKPLLYLAHDNFLMTISRHRDLLGKYFLFNLPDHNMLGSIVDKFKQYEIAKNAGIPLPKTFFSKDISDVHTFSSHLDYPVFIKGLDVSEWRKNVSSTTKGFEAKNKEELISIVEGIHKHNVRVVVQELIKGPDTNHCKFCVYISKFGEVLCSFTLRKIRQWPIRFGIGSTIESINNPVLMELGLKLFKGIDFRGVGSAEFKLDERDGKLKLIEINPRYWLQAGLPTICGMNFPLMQYLDLTDQKPKPLFEFKSGVKWIDIRRDISSFNGYKKLNKLSTIAWLKSLKGEKMFSDFSRDDIGPALHDKGLWKTLLLLPFIVLLPPFLLRKIL
ncbi:MAG: hypothetical protein MRJ65_13890 [Candidatus Brocadiaceae bacterium]|nr:hypothetical protein [Candidatus Brocadiaceae bacterium]